jgi:cardiolipin synthase
MSVFQNVITIVTVLNIMLAIVVIFLERRSVGATWAWLMVLLFLPAAGFFLYLLFGQNLSRRKLYKLDIPNRDKINKMIQNERERFTHNQVTYNDPLMSKYSSLLYMNLTSSSALFTQDNKVDIYTDGHKKFEALMDMIEGAEHHIHLMTYIIRDDKLGNRLVAALTNKAKEGIQVRILYDHIGSYQMGRHFFKELIESGGQVVSFFPSKIPYLNIRVNYRNHRKLAIIDGKCGFIGGFNIGEEYLGVIERFGYWRDTHLRVKGSAVQQMQTQFFMDWNLASSEPLQGDDKLFPKTDTQGDIGIQIVTSGPNDTMEQIKNAYIKMINAAKRSICIQTPYFIPDESLLTALKMAVLSGIEVKLMIPSKPDRKMVYWASYSYLGELLEHGMKVLLYEKGFLHAKTIVVDNEIATVGTANVDIRSFKLNFEVNAMIYSSVKAAELADIFEVDMQHCKELTYSDYQSRPRIEKFRESCTRLLSPIL